MDYSTITEYPGLKASREQLVRLYHRYHFASGYAEKKEVLEVACGTGIGLGYLASKAKYLIGCDIDEANLKIALDYYQKNSCISIVPMDAHHLNFSDNKFDLVIFYEAIYYLREPLRFVSEAWRVLKEDGALIICSVNKEWVDFHPSPYSQKYFSLPELYSLLNNKFPSIQMYGAFPVDNKGVLNKLRSNIKRIANRFNLIPGSLSARAYLKRIFIGPLKPLPEKIYDRMVPYQPPIPLSHDLPNRDYKIIYAVAKKRQS